MNELQNPIPLSRSCSSASITTYCTSQSISGCDFGCVIVTSTRATGKADTPFILSTPLRKEKLADFVGRRVTPSQLRETKSQQPQALLTMPTFQSPLMFGHVTGLHRTRSGPTGKFRANRYFHDSLVAEQVQYTSQLHDIRAQQSLADQRAAVRIQNVWRAFIALKNRAKEEHSKERQRVSKLRRIMRHRLWEKLGADPRCSAWVLGNQQGKKFGIFKITMAAKALTNSPNLRNVARKAARPKKDDNARSWNALSWKEGPKGPKSGRPAELRNALSTSSEGEPVPTKFGSESLDSAAENKADAERGAVRVREGRLRSKKKSLNRTDDMFADIDSWAASAVSNVDTKRRHHREVKAHRDLHNSAEMVEAKRLDGSGQARAEEKARELEETKARARQLRKPHTMIKHLGGYAGQFFAQVHTPPRKDW
mmetsp:Transcript_32478/g.64816  ORF Transcript_32478/g.64816 Transcript_32478/m.64816 type:complete len:425 (+) Transcript_32478:167-1441(+)